MVLWCEDRSVSFNKIKSMLNKNPGVWHLMSTKSHGFSCHGTSFWLPINSSGAKLFSRKTCSEQRDSGLVCCLNSPRVSQRIGQKMKDVLGGGFKDFFIFAPIWGRFPIWLIFFRWVETTNQCVFFGVIRILMEMEMNMAHRFLIKLPRGHPEKRSPKWPKQYRF